MNRFMKKITEFWNARKPGKPARPGIPLERPDVRMPKFDYGELKTKYMRRIRPKEADANQMIAFLKKNFSVQPLDMRETLYLNLNLEWENCKSLNREKGLPAGDFEVFSLIKDYKSTPFYDVMNEDEEWESEDVIIVLIEKNLCYMNSNCHELDLLLVLEKGVTQEDYCSENENLRSYLELLEMINIEYDQQERKDFKMLPYYHSL